MHNFWPTWARISSQIAFWLLPEMEDVLGRNFVSPLHYVDDYIWQRVHSISFWAPFFAKIDGDTADKVSFRVSIMENFVDIVPWRLLQDYSSLGHLHSVWLFHCALTLDFPRNPISVYFHHHAWRYVSSPNKVFRGVGPTSTGVQQKRLFYLSY